MHGLLAGFMGFLMGATSFFHGGPGTTPHNYRTNTTAQTNISGTPAPAPSGMMRGRFGQGRGGMNLPGGERPFFGTVTTVNGSTLTLETQMGIMMRGGQGDDDAKPTITPRAPRTITVTLDSSTKYTGGTQSDITTNTKVAGIAKTNSDGSLTAVSIQINPTQPSGNPMWGGRPGQ